jgi:hypothetical protein
MSQCNASSELGEWGACTGSVAPNAETCNGVDDDCNGVVDDVSTGHSCGGQQIIASYLFTCAIVHGGQIACWGFNQFGLGTGSTTMSLHPVLVDGISDATQLSAGDSWVGLGGGAICARRASGHVSCWGSNNGGELGDGTTTPRLTPVDVVGLTDAVQVATGGNGWFDSTGRGGSTCAVRSNGQVVCWGTWGPNGSTMPHLMPTAVDGISNAMSVTVGGDDWLNQPGLYGGMNCALLAGGTVSCWQLDSLSGMPFAPTIVPMLTDAVQITGGGGWWGGVQQDDAQVCAVRATGDITCWGSSPTPTTDPSVLLALHAIDGIHDAVQVSVSGDWQDPSQDRGGCAVHRTGQVSCWGRNDYGQLGDGTRNPSMTPVQVTGLTDAVEVSSGWGHACARRATGAIVCWGLNQQGQLGNGMMDPMGSPTPVEVMGLP